MVTSVSWLATRSVAPDHLLAALAVLKAQGHDTAPAKRAGRLPPDFEATAPRVSFLAAAAVWRHIIRVCRDPALGIRVAEQHLTRSPSLLSYLVRTSPTLADGLRLRARFAPLEDEQCRASWTEGGETGTFRYLGSAEFYLAPVTEFVAARLVGATRMLATPELSPIVVRFVHAAPSSTSAHRRFFRCPIEFRAETFEVVYARSQLHAPLPTADAALHKLLLQYAEQRLADALRSRGVAERVRELIIQLWQEGDGEIPSRTQLARMLRVAPRTLGRWLEAEGKTYSDVLDEFRALAAMRSLEKPDTSLVETAQRLGFRDQSAFTHAFRRWTSMTPGQYRRLHAHPKK